MITGVERLGRRTTPPAAGLTLPGLANCHSHAFHRALRGHTQRERRLLLDLARADVRRGRRPDAGQLLRARPVDVRRDGGDRDHRGGGVPLPAPPARRDAVRRPERDGPRPARRRRRRRDPDPAAGHLLPRRRVRPGARGRAGPLLATATRTRGRSGSPRSTTRGSARRSTPCARCRRSSSAWSSRRRRGLPLHVHLSEQVAENEACVAATGRTPTQLLAEAGALGPLTTAVHATHLTDDDVAAARREPAPASASARRPSATWPTGSVPRARLHEAGAVLTLGSDSHAVIDLFEEMRAVELHERLATRRAGPLVGRRAAGRRDPRRPRQPRVRRRRAGSRSASGPTSSTSTSTSVRTRGTGASAETAGVRGATRSRDVRTVARATPGTRP